jgi:hypothetical protein
MPEVASITRIRAHEATRGGRPASGKAHDQSAIIHKMEINAFVFILFIFNPVHASWVPIVHRGKKIN